MIYVQFQNSPNIVAYVRTLKGNIKVSISDFLDDYFSIDTCDGDGLDNWGRILNRNRTVLIPDTVLANTFGFDTGDPPPTVGAYPQNFGFGNYAPGEANIAVQLDDIAYRALLKFIYLTYVTNSTLQTINANLNYYFNPNNDNGKQVVVSNSASMQITYTFNFQPQEFETILFDQPGVLPTPVGVEQILVYPS